MDACNQSQSIICSSPTNGISACTSISFSKEAQSSSDKFLTVMARARETRSRRFVSKEKTRSTSLDGWRKGIYLPQTCTWTSLDETMVEYGGVVFACLCTGLTVSHYWPSQLSEPQNVGPLSEQQWFLWADQPVSARINKLIMAESCKTPDYPQSFKEPGHRFSGPVRWFPFLCNPASVSFVFDDAAFLSMEVAEKVFWRISAMYSSIVSLLGASQKKQNDIINQNNMT